MTPIEKPQKGPRKSRAVAKLSFSQSDATVDSEGDPSASVQEAGLVPAGTPPMPAAGTSGTVPVVTKLSRVIGLLSRQGGATLAELCDATGWQTHSVRGALAGALKKKGHVVTSEVADGTRHYRIGDRA